MPHDQTRQFPFSLKIKHDIMECILFSKKDAICTEHMVGYEWILIMISFQADNTVFGTINVTNKLFLFLPFFLTDGLILPINDKNMDRYFKFLNDTID